MRLTLEAGGDPNHAWLVAHAVRRGCGPAMVRLLAEHGGDVSLRTPYQNAVLRGRDDRPDRRALSLDEQAVTFRE